MLMIKSALTPRPTRRAVVVAVLLWGFAHPLSGQVGPAISQAEAWLAAVQNADGSFGTHADLAPRDSALAVLALEGGTGVDLAVTRGAIYLEGVPESNTHFRSQRALALATAGRPFTPLLDSLFDFRNGGGMGAFGEYQSTLLDTGLAVEALALDEGPRLLDIVSLLDFLQLHQGADGGWGFAPGAHNPQPSTWVELCERSNAQTTRTSWLATFRGKIRRV